MRSWYSWWTGSLGIAVQRRERDQSTNGEGSGGSSRGSSHNRNKKAHVGLIVGVTGMVGSRLAEILPRDDIPGGPWKVYGVARRPNSPNYYKDIQYIQCDLLDRDQTMVKFSALTDVTHVFWVITNAGRGIKQANLDGKMLANVLDSLIPNAPNLEHVCLQTGTEHYPGAHDISAIYLIIDPDKVLDQDRLPRLTNGLKFSHHDKLQDVLFEKLGGESDIKISWSINRPTVILFGFSPLTSDSSMNILFSLAVYAAICKEGMQFRFPGNSITWEGLSEASDAEPIAEQ